MNSAMCAVVKIKTKDFKFMIAAQSVNKTTTINYNELMEQELKKIVKTNAKPTLILHSCCAPCSSYVLKLLQEYFNITVFFYNSNLYPSEEYLRRLKDQKKLIRALNKECKEKRMNGEISPSDIFMPTPIKMKTGEFVPQEFYDFVKGYEKELEGSNRCYLCYMLRLNKTAEVAVQNNYHYFATTLSVSPYKNSKWVNEVGEMVAKKRGAKFLFADFKKNDGYKKSIEYSKEYGLYRQNYCGCEFSYNAKKQCLV